MTDEQGTGAVPFEMPAYVVDRVMQKRGRLRVFDRFPAAETALVVIDMQKFYVGDVATALAVIPTINRLATGFRDRDAQVIWVKMTAGRNGKSLWPLYHERFMTPENGARHRDELSEGAEGHRLHEDLDVRDGDLIVEKRRFSAFLPAACDLHEVLMQRGIRHVAIAGMITNFCCETSARDAMMLDYRVAMVSDATAARHADDHRAGFTTVFQSFADVVTADQMLGELLA